MPIMAYQFHMGCVEITVYCDCAGVDRLKP